MFSLTHVQLKYWFYPTGNTPAVNLLRDLPAHDDEEDKIRVLNLACGDPRNILFSLWCEHGHNANRTFEFTCCDIEPAVLARNVVLFSLIHDRASATEVWELFYHFFVPQTSRDLLKKHAKQLLLASESIQNWASSIYGNFIHFVDKATLRTMRKYWAFYISDEQWPQARTAIAARSKEIGESAILTGVRAAGSLWFHASAAMGHTFRQYWKTGVAGGNSQDLSRLGNIGTVNPMFAASSSATGKFAVHYGTEPLLGFHLAEAFQERRSAHKEMAQKSVDRVVQVAKSQFRDWCDSFRNYVEAGRVYINLFCGEALALSHELQLQLVVKPSKHTSRSYSKPWSACPLLLDGHHDIGEPLGERLSFTDRPFNIIDTSNLGDHLGPINILTATAPLLRRSPSSVIYNETLLMASEDISASLTTMLGSDIATFSLLLGLVPTGLMTGVTVDGVGNETGRFSILQDDTGQARQYRMRATWKCPEFADPTTMEVLKGSQSAQIQVQFEAKALADLLFSIYHSMFAHEDLTKIMGRMMRMRTGHYSDDLQRYTRAAMVALLRIVRTRIIVDWEQTMILLFDLIAHDKQLIVGSNSLQELCLDLHLYEVWTAPFLKSSIEQMRSQVASNLRSPSGEVGILAAISPPPIIYLVLTVPRQNLKIFTDRDPDVIGSPSLYIAVSQAQGEAHFENVFHSFHSIFGKIENKNIATDIPIIKVDEAGWAGTSDLIVTTALPTLGVLTGPRKGIRAALLIDTSPANMANFQKLGTRLTVFEAGLEDEERLFVCQDAPGLDTSSLRSTQKEWISRSQSRHSSAFQTAVRLNGENRATHLQNHVDFPKESSESKALSSGSEVKVVGSSPTTLLVRVGDSLTRQLIFPFPIQGSLPRIRVARKSSWIEVQVPMFSTLDGDRFDTWTQLIPESPQRYICWSISRVNLEIQPIIRFPPKGDSSWIQTFMGTTISDSERALNDQGGVSTSSPKLDLKQSINILFHAFAGLHPHTKGSVKTFQISIESTGCHTIILATAVRHDLDVGSLVMEAFVIPFTLQRVKELHSALYKLQTLKPLSINMTNEESTLFKLMLPALAERCRTWKHQPACPYPSMGVPVSIEEGRSPLCGCGEGKISGAELARLGHKEWAPFAKYATRIAIAPIFPVPYVESSLFKHVRGKHASRLGRTENSQITASSVEKCGNCDSTNGTLKACGGCGKVKYCGYACQKAAWKEHKGQCKKL